MPGSSEKVLCADAGFEFNLGRGQFFFSIPTHSFLPQPYMIYSIFIANIVQKMKPYFVQIEVVMRKLRWFGNG